MLTLLLKLDKKVRGFNGLKQNKKHSKKRFYQFWHKIVDKDTTEIDVKYDCAFGKERKEIRVEAYEQEANVFHIDPKDISKFDEAFWKNQEEESEYNETQLDINALYDDQNRATKK